MVKHDLLYHMLVILENGYVSSMKVPLQTQFIIMLTRMIRCVDFSFYLWHKITQDVRFAEVNVCNYFFQYVKSFYHQTSYVFCRIPQAS